MAIDLPSYGFLSMLSIDMECVARFVAVCAIYSVDAHPTLKLFATAGGDNSVKIWSLEPQEEGGIASFQLLATLANHQQAVNCVRWAGHGRYLASGADDQLVLLYELQEGAPAPVPFGSNARINEQNWTRCATLERHTMGRVGPVFDPFFRFPFKTVETQAISWCFSLSLACDDVSMCVYNADVADVAWSPDDRMLATCSIDNTILIWDVGVIGGLSDVMTQPMQTLTGHNGWVKGVAWDPVGKVRMIARGVGINELKLHDVVDACVLLLLRSSICRVLEKTSRSGCGMWLIGKKLTLSQSRSRDALRRHTFVDCRGRRTAQSCVQHTLSVPRRTLPLS